MQHIFIAEIDGKEIDMAAMLPEEKQKVAAGIHRGRAHYAHRLNDREPVFLRVQRDSEPFDGV